jgi:hypothetical protein
MEHLELMSWKKKRMDQRRKESVPCFGICGPGITVLAFIGISSRLTSVPNAFLRPILLPSRLDTSGTLQSLTREDNTRIGMTAAAVKLSCERCRRRKTKCDKGSPCSNCKDAEISCTGIERARLPRGPSGKVKNRNAVLATRVARLEGILRRVEGQTQPSGDGSDLPTMFETAESISYLHPSDVDKLSQLYAKDIWSSLSEEVTGLRETLEASDDDGEPPEAVQERTDNIVSSGAFSRRILFAYSSPLDGESLDPPSRQMRSRLLHLYQERVDCLFKITHWPTVFTTIEKQYTDNHYRPSLPSTQALEFSVYFLAICSINDHESQEMFLENRQSLVQRFRVAAEMLISKANLLNSPDLITLQAFVIYLKGLYSCMQYTATWTLLATAVRIATAIGLPVNEAEGWSAYELETRRRIWFCIDVLDFQTAADRGSVPLIASENTSTPPLLTNDSDLSASALPIPPQLDTDMSLVYVYREASTCMKRLFNRSILPDESPNDWHAKLRTVAAFRECMEQHSARIHDPKNSFRLCAQFSTNAIAMDMELFLRRPPFRVKHIQPPIWDDFDILGRTTEILELNLTKPVNTTFAPWAWFAKPWVRWYILAVLLAELCTPREGDLTEKAYRVAKENFARYGELIADTDLRTLWKPLVKLMRHVDRVRERVPLASTTSTSRIASEAGTSSSPFLAPQPVQSTAYNSGVILSYEVDARERVMDWVSTKEKNAASPENAKSWKENTNDWQLSSTLDLMDNSTPSHIWDSFLDDLGGYNRCFM